jgi:hypothetical protein
MLAELPRMKELAFETGPDVFMLMNDPRELLGKRHGSRKICQRQLIRFMRRIDACKSLSD